MANKNILITCGRSPAALDLIRNFKKAGHQLFIAEPNNAHLCRFSNAVKKSFIVANPKINPDQYINDLVTIVKNEKIDFVLPIFEEVFYISQKLNQFTNTEIFTDDFTKLDQLHNKYSFTQLIKDTGIDVPHTIQIHSVDEYENQLQQKKIVFPHVLKPVYSRSGAKVKFVFQPEKIKIDIAQNKPWVVQQFIPGKLICTYSLCHQGRVLADTAYYNLFQLPNGAGIHFTFIEHKNIREWINIFVKKMNYTGQIAFDFILHADKSIWAIECNPRMTSGIHLFQDEPNIVDAFLNKTIIKTYTKPRREPMIGLAMFIYALPNIKSFKEFQKWFKHFILSKDVVLRWNDLLPFVYQFFSACRFKKFGRKNKMSLIEAITYDLEWNGEAKNSNCDA